MMLNIQIEDCLVSTMLKKVQICQTGLTNDYCPKLHKLAVWTLDSRL